MKEALAYLGEITTTQVEKFASFECEKCHKMTILRFHPDEHLPSFVACLFCNKRLEENRAKEPLSA